MRRGDDVGSYWDSDGGNVLEDYEPDGLGAKVCQEALGFLGARSSRTAELPVIAGPLVSDGLFRSLVGAASAEHVQRNRTYMVGRLGEKIAPDFLTIKDDAFIPRGGRSGAFDEEGAVRKQIAVVENGVLANLLHGSYTANRAGVENTGHGTRSGGVSATNVIPSLGDATAAEIIADTKEGIYLNMGSLSPDMASGDISSTVDFGYKIENGELACPLKSTMIGTGIFELLDNIDAISSDYRAEPGRVMPTVRVHNVKVAGSE